MIPNILCTFITYNRFEYMLQRFEMFYSLINIDM